MGSKLFSWKLIPVIFTSINRPNFFIILSGFHWRWGSPSKRLILPPNIDHRSRPIVNKNCVLLCRSKCVLTRIRILIILIVWTYFFISDFLCKFCLGSSQINSSLYSSWKRRRSDASFHLYRTPCGMRECHQSQQQKYKFRIRLLEKVVDIAKTELNLSRDWCITV